MSVVRRRYHNRIDVLLLVEHNAIISVELCFRIFLNGLCGVISVNVAQGYYILALALA